MRLLHTVLFTVILSQVCLAEDDPSDRRLSGGSTTVFTTNRTAYSKSAANLPVHKLREFAFGDRLFNTNWVIAPASTDRLDGLGPLFNRVSCSACHIRDGRGQPPATPDEPLMTMLVRLSIPGRADDGGPLPHPLYGGQLQDRAILGTTPEGTARVTYSLIDGQMADGEPYALRKPEYEFISLGYGPLGRDILFSPRVANAVFGLGLLEAISDETLIDLSDPDDANGDGISGRVNRVWDIARGMKVIGRFGWKANAPTLRQQAAAAFNGDIGITSSLFPVGPDTAHQNINSPSGGEPEIEDTDLDKLEFYLRTLAVPARRDVDDPQVMHGERLFSQIGCATCHTPVLRTTPHDPVPELAGQVIQPFTDLLLHDMGPGLADGRPDYEATGSEWRTPPLWGLGLLQEVNGHTYLLHDGRARNITEAILWHGGEAQASRDRFIHLNKSDRLSLLRFLNSL